MPATFTTLRKHEILEVTATVKNNLDEPSVLFEPNFSEAGTPNIFQIISGESGSLVALISGETPGSAFLFFGGENELGNSVDNNPGEPVTVLDANAFSFIFSGAVDCAFEQREDRLLIRLLNGDPDYDSHFFIRAVPIDQRFGETKTNPVYALSDGPNWVSLNGILQLNSASPGVVVPDAPVVFARNAGIGQDTITVTGTAAATGQTLSAVLEVTIVGVSTVTLTARPV